LGCQLFKLELLIGKKVSLILSNFTKQSKQFFEIQIVSVSDVGLAIDEVLLKALNHLFDRFLSNVVSVNSGKKIVSDEEEQKYKVSCNFVYIVINLHFISQGLILDFKALLEYCEIDQLKIDLFFLSSRHYIDLIRLMDILLPDD